MGGAHYCEMATRKEGPSLFTSANVQWTSLPVVFHNNHGKNVVLSQNNTVATRERSLDYYGIVCTSEPVTIGQMFKVTMLEEVTHWGGLVSLQ